MDTFRLRRLVTYAAALCVSCQSLVSAQEQSQFRAESLGIVVDVSVRNEAGDVLKCLPGALFSVVEDGIPQRITSVDAVGMSTCEETESSPTTSPQAISVKDAIATPPVVTALVFEELGPEARVSAWRAATAFVEGRRRSDEFIGVFYIDRVVHTLVPYTLNTVDVLNALRKAAMRPGCPVAVEGDVPGAAGDAGCHRGPPIDTLRSFRQVVSSLANLPGRKNAILFSEGFTVQADSNEFDAFERLVGEANQGTVTFHSVDAAGLRTVSGSAATRRALGTYTGGVGNDGGPKGKLNATDLLALDPTAPLERLARDTGGQYVSNTNGLNGAVKTVGADMHAYYRLTYIPSNQASDSRFRRITVTVNAPGAVVRSRSGYYPDRRQPFVRPQELAPHLLLDAGPLPRDFEMIVDAAMTKDNVDLRAVVSAKVLRFDMNDSTGHFEGAVTILARLRARDQRVIATSSETFALSSSERQLEAARTRSLRFQKVLPRSRAETLEVIAYDVLTGRASAIRVSLSTLPRRR